MNSSASSWQPVTTGVQQRLILGRYYFTSLSMAWMIRQNASSANLQVKMGWMEICQMMVKLQVTRNVINLNLGPTEISQCSAMKNTKFCTWDFQNCILGCNRRSTANILEVVTFSCLLIGKSHLRCCDLFWVPQFKACIEKRLQSASKIVRDLEHTSFKKKMGELGLFNPEKKEFKEESSCRPLEGGF